MTATLAMPPPMTELTSPVALDGSTVPFKGALMGREGLTPSEVAERLGVSAATIRRWDKRGLLVPAMRFPGSGHRRYTEEQVEEFRLSLLGGDDPTEKQ